MDTNKLNLGKIENLHVTLSNLVHSVGARLKGRVRSSVPLAPRRLATLASERLESAILSLQNFENTLLKCEELNVDPWDDREFLQLSLKQLGMTASREFLDTIDGEDLIEGYNLSNIQVYRNMRFMEICGYSLEDVLTYEWFELYERSSQITSEVMKKVSYVLETGKTIPLNVGNHYMKERISANRQISEVSFRYVGPLFSGAGNPAGVLISTRARVLDEHPSKHELRFL